MNETYPGTNRDEDDSFLDILLGVQGCHHVHCSFRNLVRRGALKHIPVGPADTSQRRAPVAKLSNPDRIGRHLTKGGEKKTTGHTYKLATTFRDPLLNNGRKALVTA